MDTPITTIMIIIMATLIMGTSTAMVMNTHTDMDMVTGIVMETTWVMAMDHRSLDTVSGKELTMTKILSPFGFPFKSLTVS